MSLSFTYFLIFFFSALDAESPVKVTNGLCNLLLRLPSDPPSYQLSVSWTANPKDDLLLVYVDPSCLSSNKWCLGDCRIPFERPATVTGLNFSAQVYTVNDYSKLGASGFSRVAVFLSDHNICDRTKRYDPSFFRATKTLYCPKAPFPVTQPSSYPTQPPTYYPTSRTNYSFLSLLLLLVPVMILVLFIIRKLRECRSRTRNAELYASESHVNTNNFSGANNSVPLYNMATLPTTNVQIFPEYPMMTANNFQSVDPTQTLTPVYTHTYTQPGVQ